MKTRKILILLLMVIPILGVSGKSKFYNSKSMIVGLTTNNRVFYSAGLGSKVFDNNIPRFDVSLRMNGNKFDPEGTVRQMNEMQVGKKILDILFERDKSDPRDTLSENLLRQRAWENVQLMDAERAKLGVISQTTILKEDILPILESNYILLTYEFDTRSKSTFGMQTGQKSKVAWIVLHADIDRTTWDDVNACWNNLEKYDRLRVNVSYVASGVAKEKESLYTHNDHPYSATIRDIAKKAPDLAVRGQIIGRSPYTANIGTSNGVKAGWDLVRVFAQSEDSKGEIVSKEIGKARVVKAYKDSCELRTVSGKTGTKENADQAVLMPIKRTGRALMYQWQGDMSALRYDFDINVNLGGPMMLHVHEIDLRAGLLNTDKDKIGDNIGTPYFAGIGTGMGLSALFMKGCELEAYGLLQLEGWTCNAKNGYKFPSDSKENGNGSITGGYINLPLGVKLQINLKYPLRIIGGVEYGLKLVGFNKDIEKYVMKPQGWKRGDLQFFVGLRYAY